MVSIYLSEEANSHSHSLHKVIAHALKKGCRSVEAKREGRTGVGGKGGGGGGERERERETETETDRQTDRDRKKVSE